MTHQDICACFEGDTLLAIQVSLYSVLYKHPCYCAYQGNLMTILHSNSPSFSGPNRNAIGGRSNS